MGHHVLCGGRSASNSMVGLAFPVIPPAVAMVAAMAAATTVVVGKPLAVLPLMLLMFSVKPVGVSAVSILIAVALTKLAAAIRFAAKSGQIRPGAAWQPPES